MINKILLKKAILNKVVNFIIGALFVTNAWIFLFNRLLNFLNTKFPSSTVTNFLVEGAVPEPFEIPLFLLLSFMAVIIMYFFHKKINNIFSNLSLLNNSLILKILKLIFLVFLLMVFINNLGSYPMGKDLFPLGSGESEVINNIYLICYISITALLVLESTWLSHFLHKKNFLIIFYIFLTALIAFLTLKPNFPFSWHDYPYIYGPVFEIAHGKTIYTQVQSQYGFLLVLFLAVLYKLNLINLSTLPIFIWLFYIVQYFLCFYLIYKLSRSFVLAFIGLFSILTINYYSLCCTITFPQIGALRWLPIIFLIFLFYKLKKIDSYLFIFILSLLSFWIVDVGMAILMAYSFSLLLLALVKIIDFKRLIKDYLLLGLTILGIFFVINLIHLLFGYQLINVLSIFTKMQEYSRAGFGMIPMASKSYFWFTLLIYFSSLVYFFQRKQYILLDQILLFSANLTLFASVYFVGRSHPLNLFALAPISILTLFIFWSIVLPKIKLPSIRTIFLLAIFIFFVFLPIYFRRDSAVINGKTNLDYFKKGRIFQPEMDRLLEERYQSEKKLINKNFKEKNILIISTDDTYLLYLTHKASLLNINPLTATISQSDLEFSLKRVYQLCPKKIVIDCEAVSKCPFNWKLNYIRYPYQLILNRINQRCHLQYKPTYCTNQLCLGVAD